MPLAYFIVRATVPDAAKREAFDEWYSREHLPDAANQGQKNACWRESAANVIAKVIRVAEEVSGLVIVIKKPQCERRDREHEQESAQ